MAENNVPNLAEMRRLMQQDANIAEANGETPIVGGMGWATQTGPTEPTTASTPKQEVHVQSEDLNINDTVPLTDEPATENNTSYTGPGLVIDTPVDDEPKREPYTGISQATQNHIDEYLAGFDMAIERAQAESEELKAKYGDTPPDESETINEDKATTIEDDFDKAYSEAVVVIDKIGVGRVLNFTEDEHAKLTKAKAIKLKEVETVQVAAYRTKKAKDPKNFNNIIKNINTLHTTPICLPMSGYTANIRGCTAYELMGLLDTGSNALLDAQTKWSLIHSKIESTSIGNMDFNEFLFNTAATDYNNFIYGILCATYPDVDTIPIKCPECKTQHEHSYSVRQLIRAERMSESLLEQFTKIIDASTSEHEALKVHEDAPIKQVRGIRLPVSGIIVEVQVQSAYDLINNSIKSISTEDESNAKYKDAAILATLIKRALIEDPENPEEMFEFTDSGEIAQIVYQLRERDLLIIKKIGDELMNDLTIEYGFMKIKCPTCGKFTPHLLVDPEQLLFQRYRQELSANIE